MQHGCKAARCHGGLMLARLNTYPPIVGASCLINQKVCMFCPTYAITQLGAFHVWPFALVNTLVRSSTKTSNQLPLTSCHLRPWIIRLSTTPMMADPIVPACLSSLPVEIHTSVFAFVRARTTQAAICLTSRQCRDAMAPILFENFKLQERKIPCRRKAHP